MKICPDCKKHIDYVKVFYDQYNVDRMQAKENDNGIYDEDCNDSDSQDSENYEYFCPECNAAIDTWDSLMDVDEEEKENPIKMLLKKQLSI